MEPPAEPTISKLETEFLVSLVERNVPGTTALRQDQLRRILYLASRRSSPTSPADPGRTVHEALLETATTSSALHGADPNAVEHIAAEAVTYATTHKIDRERFDLERLRAVQALDDPPGLLGRIRSRLDALK